MARGRFVYLDLDLNDSRARYKRACEFVSSNSIKYGLSSDNIKELGGRELKSLNEIYKNDFEWSSRGTIRVKPQPATRLVIELFVTESPLATENFFALCAGDKGKSKSSGVTLSYVGSRFHRYVSPHDKGLGILQGGDITFGNGTGGESIWGKKFKDDANGLKMKHDKKGVVSMGNGGKNSNTSQFFICLKDQGAPACDKKHVVLGQIIHGFDTLDLVEKMINEAKAASSDCSAAVFVAHGSEEPPVEITVAACGEWCDTDLLQGYWDHDDAFKALSDNRKGASSSSAAPPEVVGKPGNEKECA